MTRKPEPVVIKKYANRRLYNTSSSTYVTLETLAEMVKDDIEFMVVDAKNGEELTRSVLTQIIMEQEAKSGANGQSLLPISFMRQLISMYGDNMQFIVPKYLEEMMQNFSQNQQRLQDYWQKTFGSAMPLPPSLTGGQMPSALNAFEQVSKQNMAVFEQMMNFFLPNRTNQPSESDQAATLNALKQKVAAMENGLQQMEKED